jgi:pimeloyl-ACP methyl ester carboxylesterase
VSREKGAPCRPKSNFSRVRAAFARDQAAVGTSGAATGRGGDESSSATVPFGHSAALENGHIGVWAGAGTDGSSPNPVSEFQEFHTISADGTTIGGERIGTGPALVVVHGGMRAGKHYRALATALADHFSVAVFDRRGRGRSGPAREDDGIEVELADLRAVMAATGARVVFGHSAGAVIGLEAALRFPLGLLVLYEPPIALAAAISVDWVPAFRRSLDQNRPARAMALLFAGLQLAPGWLPRWLVALALRLAMRTQEGRELAALLRTMPRDLNTILALEGGCERYRAIRCPTLLLAGAKSPAYLRHAIDDLASSIPDAVRVEMAGMGHNAPDEDGPARVAAEIATFCLRERSGHR